jgi:two-component system phosphate regulon sensor histidine kinase PhoR
MMTPKKLIWQIFPANVLIIFIVIAAASWYGAATLQEFYLQEKEADLEARANLISLKVKEYLREDRIVGLREYAVRAGRSSGTRITVIAADGKVLADSNENPDVMDNHRLRVEIVQAFNGTTGRSRRYSNTVEENMIYVAIPLTDVAAHSSGTGEVDAILRTSVSVASLDYKMDQIRKRILFGSLAAMVLAGAVTLLISRNISKPLEQMTRTAGQFSRGDFSERMLPLVKKSASLEVVTLAGSMDRMAEMLDDKIQAILTQRNQLEAVFSSMVEAVLAIDTEERVISINDAAAHIFGVEKEAAKGRIVQQIVRNIQLQQQIGQTLATKEPAVGEIILQDESGDRFLQSNVVTLSNGAGENVGVLVVMNDVTKLRRLENVRRDFVANVSHELRTPITSIRGYVETLLDGAIDSREDAVKFLEIVLRHSVRLGTIIDDLLVLSRIEEESKQGAIVLQEGLLLPVLEAAVQVCQLKAEQAEVTVSVLCPENVVVGMNATLLEQAVVNLLVNAITYSRKGDQVTVEVAVEKNDPDRKVRINVRDTGCGIAAEHLPRLFERFYRSDKARSRTIGGTGLGLAIVRHIAQAHEGGVEVRSEVGKGSEFTLIVKSYPAS